MHPQDDKLNWSAFCYLTDELTPAEALDFEERLATDQAAREALAEAVQLTQALAACARLEPTRVEPARIQPARRNEHRPIVARLALAAAACVALVVGADAWLASRPQ